MTQQREEIFYSDRLSGISHFLTAVSFYLSGKGIALFLSGFEFKVSCQRLW